MKKMKMKITVSRRVLLFLSVIKRPDGTGSAKGTRSLTGYGPMLSGYCLGLRLSLSAMFCRSYWEYFDIYDRKGEFVCGMQWKRRS